ncbi:MULTISPECIES: dihydrodipicolinate synthase family protein [unclassified Actinomyces]|uniref:dihydrodipicolinate synthase family protein n=1 Tax=unclassified Actinomyces TaxID=2609248 RepID=UPI0013A6A607|nr:MULTISPECIES: dihydrodipicolinate synthase family protein [unclassified Actinomyces]MBW3069649.1 dihydrodipicolinate synthase family protein [Actinomyces sp. 594]NDR54415.1 dihydrodipicolinate synthase family protein [Actinomyces sp. 565]
MDTRFTGVIPPVITPFKHGEIDLDSLRRTVDFLVTSGVHGLFIGGSSGEIAYLTDSQRDAVFTAAVEQAAGRVPVLAGVIDTTAHRVIEQARRAESLGVDAVVAACPFYAINDAGEIADHFRAIAAALSVPLLAYDVPVRLNGKKLDRDLLVALGKEGVLAGVKDSSGDDVGFRRLVAANAAAGHPLALLTGHECVVDGMALLGADGCVPGYGNVEPRAYAELWEAARAGRWQEARTIQERLCAGFEIVYVPRGRSADASGIGAFKTVMAAQGTIDTNEMAFPVRALEGETRARILAIARTQGLI